MSRFTNGAIVATLICAAGAAGFWFGRETRPEAAATQPAEAGDEAAAPTATVQARPLTSGEIAQTIEAYGTVQPAAGSALSVSVPVDVRVERVLVVAGAHVEAGAPLVEVGPTPETELQLRQARDAVAAADRNAADARTRLSEQLATNLDVATAEQAQQVARTQLDALTARGVQSRHALTSGSEGVVTQVNVQAGQIASAGTALVSLDPPHTAEAALGVEPADAGALKVGDAVELADVQASADAAPVVGTIRAIAEQVDPQSRLRNVSVTLPPEATLLRGAMVVGRLTTARARGLLVPRSAVMPDDGDQVLFVVRDGKAVREVVKVGLEDRETALVIGDALREGDAVVTGGNLELEDGMAVRVAPATTGPADASETTTAPATAAPATTSARRGEAK